MHITTPRKPAARPFLAIPILASLPVVSLATLSCSPQPKTSTAKPLTGSLNVLVRPPDRTIDPVPVANPGALPVESGGAMVIDVELDEPAFIYLVWIKADGEIVPLYPWNNETLEVKDINQPPPLRRASKRIFSPLLGRSWTFGDKPGVETVILLTRRTALPTDVHIAALFASPPAPKFDNPTDLVSIRIPNSPPGNDVSVIPAFESKRLALTAFVESLTKQFEHIEAVQFAHEDKKPD